jgi:hypothetical protein
MKLFLFSLVEQSKNFLFQAAATGVVRGFRLFG